MSVKIKRSVYADMFGPTTGDRVRLADTDLIIEVEKDFTVYGEEVKFGGGKVIRDGMGQSQMTNAAGAVDTVITNALILDHWGIVKADVGLKAGRIAAVVVTPLPASPVAPTPSPGLHLFEDPPETGAPAAAAGNAARKPAGKADEKPAPRVAASGAFWVQALSAGSEKEARGRLDRLSAHGFGGTVSSASGPSGRIYRVRIGPYGSREEAEKAAARLRLKEKLKPWVVPPGK